LACKLDVEHPQRPDARGRLGTEEEVAPDRHQRHHREILIDGRDAERARVSRRLEMHGHAIDEQFALVRLMRAREDLDEARLAGPVVAQHARDGARVNVHRDVLERDHVAVVLRQVARLEQVRRGVAHPDLAPAARARMAALSMTASTRMAPWNAYT